MNTATHHRAEATKQPLAKPGFLTALPAWWQRQAYRHKRCERLLYLMFVSGVLLLDHRLLDGLLSWQLERWLLLFHLSVGLLLFTPIFLLFWSAHRRLLLRSRNAFLKATGRILEWLLLLCIGSGIYLFFFGNSGAVLNNLISDVHWYSSWLLLPILMRHGWRWSVLNLGQYFAKKSVQK